MTTYDKILEVLNVKKYTPFLIEADSNVYMFKEDGLHDVSSNTLDNDTFINLIIGNERISHIVEWKPVEELKNEKTVNMKKAVNTLLDFCSSTDCNDCPFQNESEECNMKTPEGKPCNWKGFLI